MLEIRKVRKRNSKTVDKQIKQLLKQAVERILWKTNRTGGCDFPFVFAPSFSLLFCEGTGRNYVLNASLIWERNVFFFFSTTWSSLFTFKSDVCTATKDCFTNTFRPFFSYVCFFLSNFSLFVCVCTVQLRTHASRFRTRLSIFQQL